MLITGSSSAERTTVEVIRLSDGLPAWWYDSRLLYDNLGCRAVAGALDAPTGAARGERCGPELPPRVGRPRLIAALGNVVVLSSASICALHGADGHLLWQSSRGVATQHAVLSL